MCEHGALRQNGLPGMPSAPPPKESRLRCCMSTGDYILCLVIIFSSSVQHCTQLLAPILMIHSIWAMYSLPPSRTAVIANTLFADVTTAPALTSDGSGTLHATTDLRTYYILVMTGGRCRSRHPIRDRLTFLRHLYSVPPFALPPIQASLSPLSGDTSQKTCPHPQQPSVSTSLAQ